MSEEARILTALGLPLVAFVSTWLFGERPNLREAFSLSISVTLFCFVVSLSRNVFDGDRPSVDLMEMMPGFHIAFQLEPLGTLFALVASGLWIVTTFYSIGYMRGNHESHQTRFYACFALAIFSAIGAAMARNLFTLFVFYEIMTLSTYPLVTHHGTEQARRGGRTYLGVLLTTSIALLMFAIAWTWSICGTLDFMPGGILSRPYQAGALSTTQLSILLALFVFGTGKAAIMPLHRWLPAAMVAPTPVSALLHAVAVVKVGVFTVMKIAVYIFGIDLLDTSGISTWLMYVAGATIMIASLVALTKDNLKARLAYSTVSQLSYIVLGAALANRWGVIGGSMHIAMHAFGKITLFFCAGAIYVNTHKTEVSQLNGLGRTMPFTIAAFGIAALSVIGLPPLGGSWSKWYLAMGAAHSGHLLLLVVLMVSSLLNIAYMMPIVVRAFFLEPTKDDHEDESVPSPRHGQDKTDGGIREAPMFCVVPLCFTSLGCVILFFLANNVYELLSPIVGE